MISIECDHVCSLSLKKCNWRYVSHVMTWHKISLSSPAFGHCPHKIPLFWAVSAFTLLHFTFSLFWKIWFCQTLNCCWSCKRCQPANQQRKLVHSMSLMFPASDSAFEQVFAWNRAHAALSAAPAFKTSRDSYSPPKGLFTWMQIVDKHVEEVVKGWCEKLAHSLCTCIKLSL